MSEQVTAKYTRAYHFVGETLRDGRAVPADGEWLEHEGPIVICRAGLHASRHPFDALYYAPGTTLCLVDVDGLAAEHDDKLVARRRRIVARIDATTLCWSFARQCARDVLHLWDAPDVVRRYLETGDETIRRQARDAAYAAAYAAAADAAAHAAAADAYAAYAAAYAAADAAAHAADAAAHAADAAAHAAADAAAAATRAQQRQRYRDIFQSLVDAAFTEALR